MRPYHQRTITKLGACWEQSEILKYGTKPRTRYEIATLKRGAWAGLSPHHRLWVLMHASDKRTNLRFLLSILCRHYATIPRKAREPLHSKIVTDSMSTIEAYTNRQATGRQLNLMYLKLDRHIINFLPHRHTNEYYVFLFDMLKRCMSELSDSSYYYYTSLMLTDLHSYCKPWDDTLSTVRSQLKWWVKYLKANAPCRVRNVRKK